MGRRLFCYDCVYTQSWLSLNLSFRKATLKNVMYAPDFETIYIASRLVAVLVDDQVQALVDDQVQARVLKLLWGSWYIVVFILIY